MRLVLTMLALCCSATAAQAQTDDFNPYQAALDSMPLAQAEPLIVASYGAIQGRYSGIQQPYDGGPVLLLASGDAEASALFLFCEKKLAGFSASVGPKVAAQILGPLTGPDGDSAVYAASDGITVFALDQALSVSYYGIGTKSSRISATYPGEAMLQFNFAGRCQSLAN